jgi:acyl carrier protein
MVESSVKVAHVMPVRLREHEEMLCSRSDVESAMVIDYGVNGPILTLVKPRAFCSGPEMRDLCALSHEADAMRVTAVLVTEMPEAEPDDASVSRIIAESPYVYTYDEPATGTERDLIDLWNEVLGRKRTGVLDDFLDLGGDSIRAVQLITRIDIKFGVSLEIGTFFDTPSVRGVAALIEESGQENQ